jgi:hypothetical protein
MHPKGLLGDRNWLTFLLLIGALALIILVGAARAQEVPSPRTNPYKGWTVGQITERHNELREAFYRDLNAWLVEFANSGIDIRTLPRSEMMVVYVSQGHPDLKTAVEAADVIVVGAAVGLEYLESGSNVIFQVERLLKGDAATHQETVRFWMTGGPRPGKDFSLEGATLEYAISAPLLLPGDRAVLLLDDYPRVGFTVQDFTGLYLVKNGRIAPLQTNLFKSEVSALSGARIYRTPEFSN